MVVYKANSNGEAFTDLNKLAATAEIETFFTVLLLETSFAKKPLCKAVFQEEPPKILFAQKDFKYS